MNSPSLRSAHVAQKPSWQDTQTAAAVQLQAPGGEERLLGMTATEGRSFTGSAPGAPRGSPVLAGRRESPWRLWRGRRGKGKSIFVKYAQGVFHNKVLLPGERTSPEPHPPGESAFL